MPFCRKCGRRLVEHSEACPDCGTSTTAPIINTKRMASGRLFSAGGDKKIAKAVIPQVSPVTIKVIEDSPAQAPPAQKPAVTPTSRVDVLKAVSAPFKVATPSKPAEQPKPVLSSKHLVKPKRATPKKPVAPFTLANARPIAGLEAAQINLPGMPKPMYPPKPAVSAPPAVQPPVVAPKPATSSVVPIVKPAPAASVQQVISPTSPVAESPKPAAPITSAPVYPSHQIIQSNTSLKEDILAHPEDYETQSFDFDLVCKNKHFWPEGSKLPVSNGYAYCLKCGERLRKPKPRKYRRYRRH